MSDTPEASREGLPRGLPRGWMVAVAIAAIGSLTLEYGFVLDARSVSMIQRVDHLLAAMFGLDLGLILLRSPDRWAALRVRWREFSLLFVFGFGILALAALGDDKRLAGLLAFVHLGSVAKLLLALVQIYLLVSVGLRALQAQEKWITSKIPAEYLLIGSFAGLVLLGTLLLWMPGARASGAQPIGLLEALFTSTSASCVTGLVVRDTGADFSAFGQLVILFLFQVGGLGIITFVAFGSVLAAKSFSVPQTVALRDLSNAGTLAEARRFVWQVVLWMLVIEGAGAVLLFFMHSPPDATALERGYWSVFHSVSAFCNAGFSLQSDSLETLRAAAGINLVVMALVIFGGLGMPVARELIAHRMTRAPFFRRFEFFKRLHQGKAHKRLSLQTRLSLWVTGFLLLVGFAGFWMLESGGVLAGHGNGDSVLVSAFQSVTTRTAGFNSVPIGDLSDATLVLMIGLMAIGAGPVSTGGGIKTVTFAVLLLTLRAMVSGRKRVEVMGRSLPPSLVRSAMSVFMLYVIFAGTTLFSLSISDPGIGLRERLFEAVSALSTVGLSTGVTEEFSAAGRSVLCLAMFVGRVGPLALVLSVFRSRSAGEPYEYPEEELVVG